MSEEDPTQSPEIRRSLALVVKHLREGAETLGQAAGLAGDEMAAAVPGFDPDDVWNVAIDDALLGSESVTTDSADVKNMVGSGSEGYAVLSLEEDSHWLFAWENYFEWEYFPITEFESREDALAQLDSAEREFGDLR